MSCRQALSARLTQTSAASLRRNFGHSYGMQILEEPPGRVAIEPRIRRLDAEKEPVGRRARERRHVEDGVIGLRELVQCPHAEKAAQCRAEHRRLEGDRNELWPAVERPPADVEGI